MPGQIFALVVGIQRYKAVPKLQGPERDMRYVFSLLQEKYRIPRDHLIPLLDHGATYEGLSNGFEKLISLVGEGDTALFYYSGHGGTALTAPEFKHISGDGYDETLVCFDSRADGNPDFADKELAWYISRLNEKGAEVVVFLDCCHAGGMHRNGSKGAIKQVDPVKTPRPITSYKGNWTAGKANDLPERKLLMLAACNRHQLAREFGNDSKGVEKQNRGVFTLALEDALDAVGGTGDNEDLDAVDGTGDNEDLDVVGGISYQELFARIRLATLTYNKQQTPQLSLKGGFDPNVNFLTHEKVSQGPVFQVVYEIGPEGDGDGTSGWKLNIGAAAGLELGSKGLVRVLNEEGKLLCEARLAKVELVRSWIEPLDPLALDPEKSYSAEIGGLSLSPFVFSVVGEQADVDSLMDQWKTKPYPLAYLAPGNSPSKYQIRALSGRWQLCHQASQTILLEEPLETLQEAIKQVCDWEGLAGVNTALTPESGTLNYQIQVNPLASERQFMGIADVTAARAPGNEFQRYRLFLKNESKSPLYWYLLLLTDGFAIHPREQDLLSRHSDWSMAHEIKLGPKGMVYSSTDRLKLICSKEPIDIFKLVRKARGATRGRLGKNPGSFTLRDWNAENLNFHTYRSLSYLSSTNLDLAVEGLRFSGHPEVRGEVSLWSSAPLLKSPGSDPVPTEFLQEAGITPVAFLEGADWHYQLIGLNALTGFENISGQPLELQLTTEKWAKKQLWPLAWNGEKLWICGKPIAGGRIAITHISPGLSFHPEQGAQLKICLFELSGQNVNLEGLEAPELAPILQK